MPISHAGELGEEFSHFAEFAPELGRFGDLPADVVETVRHLNEYLAELSGPDASSFWSFESLATDARWEYVRSEATTILRDLDHA